MLNAFEPSCLPSSKASKRLIDEVSVEYDRTVAWVTRDVYRLYESETQRILASDEITIAHWYYLRVLSKHGTLNQLDLGRRVGIAAATAVPALNTLERRGLVKRTRDENDRRKNDVSLTELGQAMIDKMLPPILAMLEASLVGADPADLAAFWRVLRVAESNLLGMAGKEPGAD